MKIKDMFKKDIARYIKGVIKAGQEDEEIVYQELEEYVITKEIRKYLSLFYEKYNESLESPTDEIGVWISGFFGSGKSHFLKILSYLLSNKEAKGKKAVDFFRDKIEDSMLMAEIEKAASIENETILFNIDSESSSNGKSDKKAIVKVFSKVFYKNLGLDGEDGEITSLEKHLLKLGKFDEFKKKYFEKFNEAWENEGRRKFHFNKSKIINIVAEVTEMSEEDKNLFDFKSLDNGISIKSFAEEVKEYINEKGDNFHLVFLVDEVGQYIGDNNNLILNLQTLSEELANHCKGKAWIIVTSQEDIDSITKVREKDFSKIQARFKIRLSFSSISVSEVIEKRLLEKTEEAKNYLMALFEDKNNHLKNAIHFLNSSGIYKSFETSEEFSNFYPFIPYQPKLLQKVFEQVRLHGSSGKHLSEGERSMLSSFQDAVKKYKDSEGEILIPFYTFYDSIGTFLASTIVRVIESASQNNNLNDFDIKMLKLLFLLKYIPKEISPTVENITILMIENIDQDKIELRKKVEESLRRLEKENLIEKNMDKYYFLTDEEQEINREIKNITLSEEEINRKLYDVIFTDNDIAQKIKYNQTDFPYAQKVNNYSPRSNRFYEIGIDIITSEDERSDDVNIISMMDQNTVYVKLENDRNLLNQIKNYLKLEKYIRNKNFEELPETLRELINVKKNELPIKLKTIKNILNETIKEAKFYINGDDIKIGRSSTTTKELIENVLKKLIEKVYTRFNYIDKRYFEEDLKEELKSIDTLSKDMQDIINRKAIEEARNLIKYASEKNKTVKDIVDYFSKIPYGWRKEDTVYCLIELYKDKEIEFIYNRETFKHTDKKFVETLLSRNNDKIEIRKKEKIDQKTLTNLKESYFNIFGDSPEKDEDDEIAADLKAKIEEFKELLEKKLLECKNNGFPGIDVLEKGLEIFKSIPLNSSNKTLFEKFIELKKDLSIWKEKFERIDSFLKEGSKQKEIFIEGRNLLEKLKKNKEYIDYSEISDYIEELKNIVEDPEPYARIKYIPEIENKIKTFENKKLSEEKKEFKDNFEKEFNNLLVKNMPDDIRERIESFKKYLIEEIESKTTIADLRLKHYDWSKKIEEFELEIGKEKNIAQNYKTSNDEKISIEDNNNSQRIILANYTTVRKISNNGDLEIFISQLKENLSKELKNGKVLKIAD